MRVDKLLILPVGALVATALWPSEPVRSEQAVVQPVAEPPLPVPPAPPPPDLTLSARVTPDHGIADVLKGAGIAKADITAATSALRGAPELSGDRSLDAQVMAGAAEGEAGRPLQQLTLVASPLLSLVLTRTGTGFRIERNVEVVDGTPRRYRGTAGLQLFWSLRAAGVPAEIAETYLQALANQMRLADVRPDARFDLVVEHWKVRRGADTSGELVFAGLQQPGARINLVRWNVDGEQGWFDPERPAAPRASAMMKPAAGVVTSHYGSRIHPILRFARFHDGMDIGAAWGSPVRAVADGTVIAAGWRGGYGRKVSLAHEGGLETGYAHLSQWLVEPGARVARGQVIGLVGSSGLSTGPHLHFTVRQHGRAVDPRSWRPREVRALDGATVMALRLRRDQLTAS